MKPAFIHRLVNGPFEDPSLFVGILRERRALLFDIGDISKLGAGNLQKITDVFVTHTHIDHFIGFDILLRAVLRREVPLRLYGPANITECIEGKLKGYTWNLIKDYPLKLEVICVDGNNVSSTGFYAEQCFQRTSHPPSAFNGILLKEPPFTVKAVQLDHQTPCLGFSLEEEFHININKALLSEMGLSVGPWLSELKKAIRESRSGDTEIVVEGKEFTLAMLRSIATITKGQKISYITDVSLTEENIRKIIGFTGNSDTLYCEAYFMDKDRDRAKERFHLTAKTAGMIAKKAGARNLTVMHFSPKYRDTPDGPMQEAMEEFSRQ